MPVEIQDIGPPTTLAAGASVVEEYYFGDFLDVGPCYCTLATFNPQFYGHLEVSRQGRIGSTMHIGGVWYPAGRRWSYTATVRNREQSDVAYNLRVAILKAG